MDVTTVFRGGAPAERGAVATRILEGPLGPMRAAAVREGICFLDFEDPGNAERIGRDIAATFGIPSEGMDNIHLATLAGELDSYFAGKLRGFSLPLVVSGTPFQEKVWNALVRIPYGETRTYADIAAAIGNPAGCRAVGNANGRNRIVILIPCHRVVAAGGGLGGYGGGLRRKRFLLDIERMRD
jgi:AraC family transcriptional regulator of adaptative response/methylated-DNA-[protein]-cysteine methyltransferase